MGLFSSKPKQVSYLGVPLENRIADSVWSQPLVEAGFDVANADYLTVIDHVVVSRGGTMWGSSSVPFHVAETSILIVQGGYIGLAVTHPKGVKVDKQKIDEAHIVVTGFGCLGIAWRDLAADGWLFDQCKKDSPEGKVLGSALWRLIGQ